MFLLCRRSLASLTLALLTSVAGEARAAGADLDPAIAQARAMAESLREVARIPGLSIAAGVGDEVVWAEGFGFADLETPAPVTPTTRFRAASVSKVLTVAALGRLVAEGKVDLDVPVQTYVPSFPRKDGTVTLRLLAGHLGGIRHYEAGDRAHDARHFESLAEALAIFASSDLVAPPGTRYRYSTFGYTLLGAALAAAGGTDFLSLMEREVFAPLHMDDSGGDVRHAIVPGRTSFFERGPDGALVHAPYVDPSYKWPGGGLLTTPSDLVRFGLAHLDADFLPQSLIRDMFTSQMTRDGKPTGVGIAWRVGEDWKGRTIVHHSGSMSGARSSIVIYPDERIVLAFMSNLTGYPPFAEQTLQMIAEPFLAAVAGEALSSPLPRGLFSYGGSFENADASGVIMLNGSGASGGFISTPEPLAAILRSHGAPAIDAIPIVATFPNEGKPHLVIAAAFGLLPLAVEPAEEGFRAILTAPVRWEIDARREPPRP